MNSVSNSWPMSPEEAFQELSKSELRTLTDLPMQSGLYHLYDHNGHAKYLGSSSMGIQRRILRYHCAGDGNSHKYSTAYNVGRMWHSPKNSLSDKGDGKISKELRSLFARSKCVARCLPISGLSEAELKSFEGEVRAIAPRSVQSWNDIRKFEVWEPTDLLNEFLNDLAWPNSKIEAIERQLKRFESL